MKHSTPSTCSRRAFLRFTAGFATAAPWAIAYGADGAPSVAAPVPKAVSAAFGNRSDAKVALVPCRSYGPEVTAALRQCFDHLGGIGPLVKGKTVTVKLNLTGTNFMPFLDRPVGESYMTHSSTAMALGTLLFAAGARRVRFVESTQSRAKLETSLFLADWDVNALSALGTVEFENTRNLGKGKQYAHRPVPTGGYMFSSFDFNHAYDETDVMVSLAKLKNHLTAGVTLTMKNLFGITPNSLYGGEAGSEEATDGRGPLHSSRGFEKLNLPGLKKEIPSKDPTYRVPRIVTDICAARPIHLAIIDGITAMSGGEGPWCSEAGPLKFTAPGVLIAGLNPVSTDAVATAVMGYANPRATRGTKPFQHCDNHLLLAEQAGLGCADLAHIEVLGLSIEKARYPYS
ncbi:MAG: DUF362 domain-containing protein [Chloroflexi bacterium]|nr:DUF362 domain-containing protein [Chloroflexota bacterium]